MSLLEGVIKHILVIMFNYSFVVWHMDNCDKRSLENYLIS